MSSCDDPMWTDNRSSTSDSDFDDKRPRFSLRVVSSNDSRINNSFDERIVASQIFGNSLRQIEIVDAQAGLGEIAVDVTGSENVATALGLAGHWTRTANSERTSRVSVVRITRWNQVVRIQRWIEILFLANDLSMPNFDFMANLILTAKF